MILLSMKKLLNYNFLWTKLEKIEVQIDLLQMKIEKSFQNSRGRISKAKISKGREKNLEFKGKLFNSKHLRLLWLILLRLLLLLRVLRQILRISVSLNVDKLWLCNSTYWRIASNNGLMKRLSRRCWIGSLFFVNLWQVIGKRSFH